MIGIVVVTHLNIAREMVHATKQIVPEANNFASVSVDQNEPPASIRNKISKAIKTLNGATGFLILTDLFGGTPSNVCLSFLSESTVEVISGVNLPMLIKLATFSQTANFNEIPKFITEYGQRNIVIASQVLTGSIKNG